MYNLFLVLVLKVICHNFEITIRETAVEKNGSLIEHTAGIVDMSPLFSDCAMPSLLLMTNPEK